jgi:hypothetical protein
VLNIEEVAAIWGEIGYATIISDGSLLAIERHESGRVSLIICRGNEIVASFLIPQERVDEVVGILQGPI